MEPRLFSRGNISLFPTVSLTKTCFNGAAAFQPRKSEYADYLTAAFLASMEPRLFSRGNQVKRGRIEQVFIVSFNGAAAFQPRKCLRIFFERFLDVASMEPRLFSRGNGRRFVGIELKPEASMEPRLFSRGNIVCSSISMPAPQLQWSRGFSAAEIFATGGGRWRP